MQVNDNKKLLPSWCLEVSCWVCSANLSGRAFFSHGSLNLYLLAIGCVSAHVAGIIADLSRRAFKFAWQLQPSSATMGCRQTYVRHAFRPC